MNKPKQVFGVFALLLVLAFAPAAWSQGPLQKATITYSSRSIAPIDIFIAQDRGFFREEGLEARLVQVRATVAIAAILSDEVQALGSRGNSRTPQDRRPDPKSAKPCCAVEGLRFLASARGQSRVGD
jgi:hypothetical protein